MATFNQKTDIGWLSWLLVISGLMMAINNIFIVMKMVVGEGDIPTRNLVIFAVCIAIWVATSFAASQPWWVVFLKHLMYSSAMFGLFLILFGLYLCVLCFSQEGPRQPNIALALTIVFIGLALYEGMRRLLKRAETGWQSPHF